MTLKYCGGALTGRILFWLGTLTVALAGQRDAHRSFVLRTIGLQVTQTLEDQHLQAAVQRFVDSPMRMRTRPDVPHELNLHAPDSPGCPAGAQSRAITRKALALAQYHG